MTEFTEISYKHVTVNGLDVSNAVVWDGATMELRDGWPYVTLTTCLPTVAIDGHVEVDDNTRKLLLELGWTPPADEDGEA